MDLVFLHARVMTLDRSRPDARAVAVRDGRIFAVGDDAEVLATVSPGARRIDLAGGMILPGLTDSHGHVMSLGRRLSSLDLRGMTSAGAVADAVRSRVSTGEWITGGGWDQNLWPGRRDPDHRPLTAAAPDLPVYLRRVDGHAGWANRRAMQQAGVDRSTPDPAGGRIVRDAAGEPTGLLIDHAMRLVERAEPKPTAAMVAGWIRAALVRCAAAGLTGVHDAGVSLRQEEAYRALAGEEALALRVYLMWDGTTPDPIEAMIARPTYRDAGGRLTLRAVKLMIDGALGSRGALLFDDYSDARSERGLLVTPPEEIGRRMAAATARGYQVAIHAIGDRGIALVLDACEAVLPAAATAAAASPAAPPFEPRPRIEHLQCVRLSDLPRLRRLGIIASMQPSHAASDMAWAEERVGRRRAAGLYAWRSVLDAGIPLAAGSDFPVDPESPLAGLQAAVTRSDPAGRPAGGWRPEQRLSLEEAVRAYTGGAAYAAFEEGVGGVIRPGARADLTILEEDLRTITPERIGAVRVLATVVGGRFAFSAI
jgi:predicted amidohydrolase YtcJ